MANGKTKVKDNGYTRILKDMLSLDGAVVQVGILKGSTPSIDPKTKKKIEVAELAAIHEFGTTRAGKGNTVTIPERSFMRTTFDTKRIIYSKVLNKLAGEILLGNNTVRGALSLFGERVVGDIKRKITGIRVPKNAPSTIKQKGFDNPLIRTGTLRARIKKKVIL